MNISIPDALIMSLMGICIVFAVLVILMGVIAIMTAIFKGRNEQAAVPAAASAAPAPVAVKAEPAKGSCGSVSMFTVPDRDAAMIMAIIADELSVPLNELRFISIREVEDNTR